RRDADNRVLNTVKKLSLAYDCGITFVAIFPRPVTDHCHWMCVSSDCFFRAKSAAENRLHSECVKIIRRYDANGCAFGAIADAQCRASNAIDNERLKERRVFFQIQKIGIRESIVSRHATRRADQREHPVLMWHERIRPDQNSFYPTEHRGICADAESEAKQR